MTFVMLNPRSLLKFENDSIHLKQLQITVNFSACIRMSSTFGKKTINMKTTLLAISILFITAVSCSKTSTKKVEKTLVEGNWKITLFQEDNENETYYFTGYVFTFKNDNTVSAVNGSTTINGTWKLEKESNDDNPKHTDLILTFPAQNNFDELNDDWHVIKLEDKRIELEDISGDGSVDKLTFEKI
jgi:hypothetical protein